MVRGKKYEKKEVWNMESEVWNTGTVDQPEPSQDPFRV